MLATNDFTMIRRSRFTLILLAAISLYLLNAGMVDSVYAAQQETKESPQNNTAELYGRVTDVITTNNFRSEEHTSELQSLTNLV